MAKVLLSIAAELAALDAKRAALLANQAEEHKKQQAEMSEHIGKVSESLPKQMSKILGREINLGECLSLIKRHIDGKSLFSTDAGGNRGKRLTEAEDRECRELMLKRAVDLKHNRTAMQVSAIAAKFDTSINTVNTRAPSAAELDAEKLIDEA